MHLEQREQGSETTSATRPYFLCGPSSKFAAKFQATIDNEDAHLVFYKKSLNAACLLTLTSTDAARSGNAEGGAYSYFAYPRALKIHQSTLAFMKRKLSRQMKGSPDNESNDGDDENFFLAVELYPFHTHQFSGFLGENSG